MIINTVNYGQRNDKTINLVSNINTEIFSTDGNDIILSYFHEDTLYNEISTASYLNEELIDISFLNRLVTDTWNISNILISSQLNTARVIGTNYKGETDSIDFKILYYPAAANMTFELGGDGLYILTNYSNSSVAYSLELLPYGYVPTSGIRELSVIGAGVFQADTYLTSITLPHTITKIESSAFTNANNLSSLTIYATTPPILEGDPFINTETQITIYVPAESLIDYQNT